LTKANIINDPVWMQARFIYHLVKNLSDGKFSAEKPDSIAQIFTAEKCAYRISGLYREG
jgi:hypothetical protein